MAQVDSVERDLVLGERDLRGRLGLVRDARRRSLQHRAGGGGANLSRDGFLQEKQTVQPGIKQAVQMEQRTGRPRHV